MSLDVGPRRSEFAIESDVDNNPIEFPSSSWLEPEEETAHIRENASRMVLPPADEAGEAETQEELTTK